jgi:SAM-dependent methyltransferase
VMDNRDAYAEGLLDRALDPTHQPPEIRAYVAAEIELLDRLIAPGARVVDIGCGTGRHLKRFADRVSEGLGVDYEPRYIEAAMRDAPGHLRFSVADAGAVPHSGPFNLALCMLNTFGTMDAQDKVLAEMQRLAPERGTRLISVYSPESVPVRLAWYDRLGYRLLEQGGDYLAMSGGFRSQHFSEAALETRLNAVHTYPLAGIAFAVRF